MRGKNSSKGADVGQLIESAVETDPAAQNAHLTTSPPAAVRSYSRAGRRSDSRMIMELA